MDIDHPPMQSPLFIKIMLFHHYSGYGHYKEDPENKSSGPVDVVYEIALERGLLTFEFVKGSRLRLGRRHYRLTDLGVKYVTAIMSVPIPPKPPVEPRSNFLSL